MDEPTVEFQKPLVHVIVNPAAGQDQPFLKTLNTVFKDAGLDYELLVTKEAGDAHRLAKQAAQSGVGVVAAYGGDGTVIETASGLIGSGVPLAILPGGTGNMMSKAYGIPQEFDAACALLVNPQAVRRPVTIAQINETYFFQLAGIGLEAKMVEGADREAKDRMGMLAYGVAALQALAEPVLSRYEMVLDGERVEAEGVSCLISVVENLGRPNLAQALESQEHPDMLDIVVLERATLGTFFALLGAVTGGNPPTNAETIHHWRAREVSLTAAPAQVVQADGEVLGEVPVRARILPAALEILAPAPESV